MSEDEVIALMMGRWDVSRETVAKLQTFATLLREESQQQNLIARSTQAQLWDRHILDSAQLLDYSSQTSGSWLDVGTGAGFPGLVVAILSRSEHVLVEPRRRRAEFLSHVVATVNIGDRVKVVPKSVERVTRSPAAVITARAVSSIESLIVSTRHLADASTIWLLHKGRNATAEVDPARLVLFANFEMLRSMTDPDAAIVKVSNLRDAPA